MAGDGDDRGKRPAGDAAEGSHPSNRRRPAASVVRAYSSQYRLLPPASANQPAEAPAAGSSNQEERSWRHGFQSLQPPRPAAAAGAPEPDADPSDSDSSDSDVDHWAEEYKRERDEARREFEAVSRKHGTDELEWEDQRKQFCNAITALSDELTSLKVAVNRLAVKVNARGDTVEGVLDDAGGQIDRAVLKGVHLGASLALAGLTSRTNEDYSTLPVGFADEQHPDEVEDIADRLEVYNDHATAIVEATHPQSVLNTLYHDN